MPRLRPSCFVIHYQTLSVCTLHLAVSCLVRWHFMCCVISWIPDGCWVCCWLAVLPTLVSIVFCGHVLRVITTVWLPVLSMAFRVAASCGDICRLCCGVICLVRHISTLMWHPCSSIKSSRESSVVSFICSGLDLSTYKAMFWICGLCGECDCIKVTLTTSDVQCGGVSSNDLSF